MLINIDYQVSAFIDSSNSSLVSLVSRWSQSNLSTNSKVSFTKQSTLTGDSLSLVHESVGVAETGVEMITVKDDTTVKVTESWRTFPILIYKVRCACLSPTIFLKPIVISQQNKNMALLKPKASRQ